MWDYDLGEGVVFRETRLVQKAIKNLAVLSNSGIVGALMLRIWFWGVLGYIRLPVTLVMVV